MRVRVSRQGAGSISGFSVKPRNGHFGSRFETNLHFLFFGPSCKIAPAYERFQS
jgi:hypothetical protein